MREGGTDRGVTAADGVVGTPWAARHLCVSNHEDDRRYHEQERHHAERAVHEAEARKALFSLELAPVRSESESPGCQRDFESVLIRTVMHMRRHCFMRRCGHGHACCNALTYLII